MQTMKMFLNLLWYHFGKFFFRIVFYPLYGMRSFGKDNIPSEGPILMLSNHQSFFDPIFCQVPLRRNLYCIARESLYTKNRFFGLLLKSVLTIPIRRGEADLAAMRKVMDKLREGWGVCLFPEGTRTYDGKVAEIKPGFGLLSRRTGAKVIPVILDGAFECWPRHKKLPSLGRVVVEYGEPIDAEKVKELGDREFARFLTEKMRQMQSQLRKKLGKEPYDYEESNQSDIKDS